MQQSIDNDIQMDLECLCGRYHGMKKSISISIRVSEEELDKFKQAARLEAYSSYSEFVRRTALIEASKIIKQHNNRRSKC